MSWMQKHELAERLKSAPEQSPLAVFKIDCRGEAKAGMLDVVFANTVKTQQRIESGVGLIGIFHKRSLTWSQQLTEALA